MFTVELNSEAVADLKLYEAHERKFIFEAIERQLIHEPFVHSKNRKQLRPNSLFAWELRCQPFRVFYQIDTASKKVLVQRVGRKDGNRLYIRDKIIQLSSNENDHNT
jgi:mRNA-degrading endonuclease RelE of RelBE toxin-antitoxin system